MRSDESSESLRKPEITLVFRFQAGFEMVCQIFSLAQEFLNARERAAGGSSARKDGFFGAIEIVPGEGLHFGTENQIRVAFPNFELMFLRGADGAADHLKDIGGGAAMAVLHSNGDADDRGRAQVAGGARRNRGDQTAIGKTPCANLYGFEQAREGAARADGIDEISLREDDRFAGSEVGSDHGQGNAKLFELAGFENALD
jgi:hypothetical protein